MNKFSEFDIKAPEKGFEGDKIRIERVLNREISVLAYKIQESKIDEFKEKGASMCLHLQISLNGVMYVIFTSSVYLMIDIKQVPEDKFPFLTTIIKENQRLKFT